MTYYEQVQQAADYIREGTDLRPRTAIILGSGLGELAERIQDAEIIPYKEIPGFPASHVAGHAARLVFGRVGERIRAADHRKHEGSAEIHQPGPAGGGFPLPL